MSLVVPKSLRVLERENPDVRAYHAALKALASRDALTGLWNRAYLIDTVRKEMRNADRYKESFSVLLLDIDHFKRINDRYGHQFGDKALVYVAELLTRRASDVACRYGGEEFALVLPRTALRYAKNVGEEIRNAAEKMNLAGKLESERDLHKSEKRDDYRLCQMLLQRITRQGNPKITVSGGIGAYPSRGLYTMDDILGAADAALYGAKSGGRNRILTMHAVKDTIRPTSFRTAERNA